MPKEVKGIVSLRETKNWRLAVLSKHFNTKYKVFTIKFLVCFYAFFVYPSAIHTRDLLITGTAF